MGTSHGHGLTHGHSGLPGAEPEDLVVPPEVKRALLAVLAPLVLATLVGLVWLWPSGGAGVRPERLSLPTDLVDATVVGAERTPCEVDAQPDEGEDAPICRILEVRLDEGPEKGSTVILDAVNQPGAEAFEVGDGVVLGYEPEAEPGSEYFVADRERDRPLLLLGLLFAAAVVALGRMKGLRALVGLAVSFGVLVTFALPALLQGRAPLPVAVTAASVIMLVGLYLAHGFNARTTTAIIGTLVSLTLTGVLGYAFVQSASLSGLASEEANLLSAVATQVDPRGLLLAGVVIGALGVLDDVTVTQAAAVWELHAANPSWGARALYRSGLRIGRDHVASTVNTLVLAYVGASMPLVVLFTLADRGLGDVLASEVIAQEVVRTLVGSIGLVASVPVTTGLAAIVVARAAASSTAPGGTLEAMAEAVAEPRARLGGEGTTGEAAGGSAEDDHAADDQPE